MDKRLDVNGVKTQIERVHLDFLCKNFSLKKIQREYLIAGFMPDLTDSLDYESLLEVKTSNYPLNNFKNRKKSQYEWWSLSKDQISDYEFAREIGNHTLYWIFVLGYTRNELTSYRKISEDIILLRDIYVLPWNIHKKINATNKDQKHIGKNNLMPKLIDYTQIKDVNTNKIANLYFDSKLPEKMKSVFLC